MANPDMMRFHLKDYLKRKKVAHSQERFDYGRQYYYKCLESFPHTPRFSNAERDAHNSAMSLWFSVGNFVADCDDEEVYYSFITNGIKSGFIDINDIKQLGYNGE
ncbi:MAG: hypothetical protein K0U39_03765 [Alphaproteobacteria bacterium]|nr:hypothetical protein [Alphaproteobacteria bacterium]